VILSNFLHLRLFISFNRMRCAGIAFAIAVLFACGSLQAQNLSRILDDADIAETPARYDLTIRFSCQVRYITHTPADQGVELRVRLNLGTDCGSGNISNESLVTPAPAVVRSIELLPLMGNEVELLIRWRLAQQFLVVPTNDQRGLRIRILRNGESADTQGKVLVGEALSSDVTTAYAINLESALLPFPDEVVVQAKNKLGAAVYTSEQEIDGIHWYRLRLGPIALRADAERVLLAAQQSYPRAWLAIADEEVAEQDLMPDQDSTANGQVQMSVDEKIRDEVADSLWDEANNRFRHKQYSAAIEILAKLNTRPSHKYRASAQELSGLAHERMGELAHAQAEYEQFLREFPKDTRASRVRKRLYALRTASLPGRQASGASDFEEGTWKLNGGIAQYYRRDDSKFTVDNATQRLTTQNGLLNDFDLNARYRGYDTDTRIRVSAGYRYDFLKNGPGDQLHVSSAFVEWSDRERGWYSSLGRQNRSGSGSFGTYDGLMGSYQWHPHFTTDITLGMPVDSSRSGLNSKRLFESVSFNFGTLATAWEPSVYLVNQTLEGKVDRQAVGAELRYFRPGRVIIGFVDYDLHFRALNSAVLVGTLQLPDHWSLNIDLEQRKSPLVTTRNALVGQPVSSLDALSGAFSDGRIKQLALDRTPDTDLYSLTASRPIGERMQFAFTAQSIKTGASPPSDGSDLDPGFPPVEGIPPDGPEFIASAQLMAASIMRSGDINIVGLRHQSGGSITTTSLGLSSRVPVWGDWRFGPQLRIDRRLFKSDGSTLWLYAPSVRLSLQRPTLLIDLEAGNELSKHDTSTSRQDSSRYYYYLGYRWQF
jgi:tetratricopeptide (TPR) repeat protein